MAVEIELKYLVSHIPSFDKKIEITQVYLLPNAIEKKVLEAKVNITSDDINTYRIRYTKENNSIKYLLTLKTSGDISRNEYETIITKEEYQKFLLITNESRIIKNRYVKYYKSYRFEFDEYLNVEPKFFTCEVELSDINIDNDKKIIESILRNDFKLDIKDVTKDKKYKNKYLFQYFCIK